MVFISKPMGVLSKKKKKWKTIDLFSNVLPFWKYIVVEKGFFKKEKVLFKCPETLIWTPCVSVPFQYASLSPAISRAKDQLLFFVVKLNQSWTTTSTRYSVLNNGVKRYLKIYLHVIITMCKYENGSLLLWNCTNWIENWMLFSKRLKPIVFGYTTPFGAWCTMD